MVGVPHLLDEWIGPQDMSTSKKICCRFVIGTIRMSIVSVTDSFVMLRATAIKAVHICPPLRSPENMKTLNIDTTICNAPQ